MNNPYGLGVAQQDMLDPSQLHEMGMAALQSGLISPEQAMANLNPVLKAIQGKGKKNPLLSAKKVSPFAPDPSLADLDKQKQVQQTGAVNVQSGNPAVYTKVEVDHPDAVKQGSGLYSENSAKLTDTDSETDKGGTKSTTNKLLSMDPAQFNSMYATAANSPAFAEQMQGVEDQADLLKMSAGGPTDYITGPLAGLLQGEFGRNVSAAMAGRQAPTPAEKQAQLLTGMGKLQDDRKDVSKQIIDAIKSQKGGSMTDVLYNDFIDKKTKEMEASAKAGAQDNQKGGQNPMTLRPKLFAAFQTQTKDDREALSNAQNALKTLGSGSKVAIAAFKNFMARASGEKGPLTDQDVANFSGDPSLSARLSRTFTKWSEGSLTDEDSADMRLLANKYVEYRKDKLNQSVDYFTKQVAPGAFQTNEAEARRLLMPDAGFGLPDSKIDNKRPGSGAQSSGSYDGSQKLPANATAEQQIARKNYLMEKDRQHRATLKGGH